MGGCGFYRMIFPELALKTMTKNIRFVQSMKLIPTPQFYQDFRIVRIQRQVSAGQTSFITDYLAPLRDAYGFHLIYEIDDVINHEDIPEWNIARKAFDDESYYGNVKRIFEAVDYLTTTTENLKQYYIEKYHVAPEKVIVIPNYLPRWWIGELDWKKNFNYNFNGKKRVRPRIGLPLSTSHFDTKGDVGYDDVSHIIPLIRDTYKQYEWCFIGFCPKPLEDLGKDKKITILPGSDLLNYPREFWNYDFQAVIAPLRDNIFNRCKSQIKLEEMWALGIPIFAQDNDCYSKYTNNTFHDSNDLGDKIEKLFADKKKYVKEIKKGKNIVDYGDANAPNGYWLEKNIGSYYNLFTVPQNTLKFDIKKMPKYKEFFGNKKETSKMDLSI